MKTQLSNSLSDKAHAAFRQRFGESPTVLIHAPGRINLIGEHTDYNHGFVLPAALPQGICFAMRISGSADHQWLAIDTGEFIEVPVTTSSPTGKGWVDYFLGAYRSLIGNAETSVSFQIVFTADLPAGAGLSSSAALTCGFLLGMQELLDLKQTREELALLAHLVERNFIGLQGGIMDQHACLLCKQDHLLLLDCFDRSYRHVPFFENVGVHLFLIDTCVQHKLTDTDYNTRAAECRSALDILKSSLPIHSLREVTMQDVTDHASVLGSLLQKRIAFVINENARVHSAVECIQRHDWTALGQLLYQSHAGLRDDYEVSCPELDFLVEAMSSTSTVLGARVMGGGFGGCTIILSLLPPTDAFKEHVISKYNARFGHPCSFIDVSLSDGATSQFLS